MPKSDRSGPELTSSSHGLCCGGAGEAAWRTQRVRAAAGQGTRLWVECKVEAEELEARGQREECGRASGEGRKDLRDHPFHRKHYGGSGGLTQRLLQGAGVLFRTVGAAEHLLRVVGQVAEQ